MGCGAVAPFVRQRTAVIGEVCMAPSPVVRPKQ